MNLEQLPEGHFGTPGPLRDKLVAAILNGEKTGTSSLVYEYEACNESLPAVGDCEAVLDSAGNRVCALENTHVVVTTFGSITREQALAEGEGFTGVSDWQRAHREFWESATFRDALGSAYQPVTDETLVVYVTFRVVG